MEAYRFIEGHERVVDHLGLWPSFHDAEVLKLVIDRMSDPVGSGPRPALDLHLRGWVMTSEVTAEGFYKLHGEAVFHFRFEGVSEVRIEGFNNQNVLSSLNLELVSHPRDANRQVLHVELEHCYEFEASFTAERARVLSITPYAQ
jgi:hypothetical protein